MASKGLEAALSSFAAPSSMGTLSKSNVRVVARIRPMNENEVEAGSTCVIQPVVVPKKEESRSPARRMFGMSPKRGVESSSKRGGRLGFLTPERKKKQGMQETPPRPRTGLMASSVEYGMAQSLLAQQKQFDFDAVFDTNASQKEVYDRSVGDAVRRNVFRGYNTTIIAYGQTGSGKTYTMGGRREAELDKISELSPASRDTVLQKMTFEGYSASKEAISPQDDDGIIPRAVYDLFKAKQRHESAGEVSIQLTYLEIYNDELRDLMIDGGDSASSLRLCDQGDDGVVVNGLTAVTVTSASHVKQLMDKAASRRITASTRMNQRSSRSHAICTLLVSIDPATTDKVSNKSARVEVIRGKLTLIDLAGSERIKETGVVGIQQQESININKDLFVLAKVISALSEKAKRGSKVHVPYRDSKLTRMLRDSLGGNCCTVMVACVSPASANLEESVNTLRYAERTRCITNSVKQNVEKAGMTPAECAAMRGENKQLKTRLVELMNHVRKLENQDGNSGTLTPVSSFEEDLSLGNSLESIHQRHSMLEYLDGKIQGKRALIASLRDEEIALKSTISTSSSGSAESNRAKVNSMSERIEALTKSLSKSEAEAKQRKKQLAKEIADQEAKLKELHAEEMLLKTSQRPSGGLLSRMRSTKPDKESIELVTIKKSTSSTDESTENSALAKVDRAKERNENALLVKQVNQLDEKVTNLSAKLAEEQSLLDEGRAELKALKDRMSNVIDERDSLRVTMAVKDDTINRLSQELASAQSLILSLQNNAAQEDKENGAHSSAGCKETQQVQDVLSERNATRTELATTTTDKQNPSFSVEPEHPIETEAEAEAEDNHKAIRIRAAKMLFWANKAIERGRDNRSMSSSFASSRGSGSEFLPNLGELKPPSGVPRNVATIATGRPPLASAKENNVGVVISNMEKIDDGGCTCQSSLFLGNAAHVDFYLPKLGMACVCGKRPAEADDTSFKGGDPLDLDNILRSWQVDFLKSVGIHTASDLVKAHNEMGDRLSRQMRKWRKEKKLASIKTKSCGIALHIWSRTCKSVIRSVREQQADGATVVKKPAFLELSSDSRTVSTLGCGSFIETGDHVEL